MAETFEELKEMEKSDDRIVQLEIKLDYLEDFMNKIQAIVVDQEEAIDKLKGENAAIKEKIGEMEDNFEEIPNRRPPHY